MSTSLPTLLSSGEIRKIQPELGPRRLPMRELYATKGFIQWAESLPNNMPVGQRLVSPAAEMNEIAAKFVAGEKIVTTMRNIMPTKHGMFRLITTSFALIGWADHPQCMVLSRGASLDETHTRGRLRELMKNAVAERQSLGLNWDGRPFYELFCFQG